MAFAACSDDEVSTAVPQDYSNVDLSIEFRRYEYGELYVTDTIQNEFLITNHSNQTIKAGTALKVGCKLNNSSFNLELTSPEPSSITLSQDLGPDQNFSYNPGYLLGNQMLAYFGTPSLSIGLVVYGIEGFTGLDADDPNPANNEANLKYDSEGIRLVE